MIATSLFDPGSIFGAGNIIGMLTILALLYFAPKYFRSENAKAREGELISTISAYKERIESLEGAEKQHVADINELHKQVAKLHEAALNWERRYREQEQYTAKSSLDLVVSELAATRQAILTGFESQTELILKTLEMQSKVLHAIGESSS